MKRTLLIAVLAAFALAGCSKNEPKSAPKTGATPPAAAPAPAATPAPATPAPATPPADASKDAAKK
jgi:nitrous oxide reductase accessory protein NosL